MAIAVLGVCLSALLFLSPGKAEADTLTYWEGYSGPSRLYDNPGMICQENAKTKAFAIAAPGMWARAGYNNGQWVTYRVVLQSGQYHNSDWYNARITNWKPYTLAYPNKRASFSETGISIPNDGWAYPYRVYVQMRWYNNSGSVVGFTERRVDSYYDNLDGTWQSAYCRL